MHTIGRDRKQESRGKKERQKRKGKRETEMINP
jgi:hypothetical protein